MIRKVLDEGTDNNWMGNWICSRPTFSQVFEVSTLRHIKMKMIISIAYKCPYSFNSNNIKFASKDNDYNLKSIKELDKSLRKTIEMQIIICNNRWYV